MLPIFFSCVVAPRGLTHLIHRSCPGQLGSQHVEYHPVAEL